MLTTSWHARMLRALTSLAIATAVLLCAGAAQASAATCVVPADYATITLALADTGCDTINVGPGTYNEMLDIDHDVAIHGAGAATTEIAFEYPPPPYDPGNGLPDEVVGVRGASTNVEIDGLTIRYASGHYVPSYPSVQAIGVHVYGGATANVHDNTITEIHNDNSNGNQMGHCVMVGDSGGATTGTVTLHNNTITYCGKQGVTVRNNSTATITDNVVAHGNKGDDKGTQWQASNGIVIYPGVSSTISGNQVYDWVCPVGTGGPPPNGCDHILDSVQSIGIFIYGAQTSLSVTGNTVYDTDGGYFNVTGGAGPFTFSGNSFHDNIVFNVSLAGAGEIWSGNTLDGALYGLVLYGDATPTSVQLMGGNTITGASTEGVHTDTSGGAVNISGSKNSFVNNNAGIDTSGATIANLRCNWWGAASGPTVASNPAGTGDPASANATYTPFSTNDTAFDCGPVNPALVFGTSSIEEGSSTTLSLTLSNDESDPIAAVGTAVHLPLGFTATGVDSDGCGATIDLSNPAVPVVSAVSLAADADCTIIFAVVANAPGSFSVAIPAGGVTSPNGNSVNAAAAALIVTAKPQPIPPTPEPPTPPAPPAPAIDPIPACFKGRLIITDVARSGHRVKIRGLARVANTGRTVKIRSMISGRIVAHPKVAADGSWSTNIAAPPQRRWGSNKARYRASLGNSKTIWTKMTRRMRSTNVTSSQGRLQVKGSATLPLAPHATAAVSASYDCGKHKLLGRLRVNSKGAFKASVATRTDTSVALVRVRISVRNSNGLVYSTYSIVQPVVLSEQ